MSGLPLRRLVVEDQLYRKGGDEFVLMIGEAPEDEGLRELAVKPLNSLEAPYPELPVEVRISASVGVARWPDHADGLLNAADTRCMSPSSVPGRVPPLPWRST